MIIHHLLSHMEREAGLTYPSRPDQGKQSHIGFLNLPFRKLRFAHFVRNMLIGFAQNAKSISRFPLTPNKWGEVGRQVVRNPLASSLLSRYEEELRIGHGKNIIHLGRTPT